MGQLSPNAMNVQGTGQTVGGLKQAGLTSSDIGMLGGGTPNTWQNLVKGGATGLAQGLQNYGSATGNQGGMPRQSRGQNNINFYGMSGG